MITTCIVHVRLSAAEQRRLFDNGDLSIEEVMAGQGWAEFRLEAHSDELRRLVEHLDEEGCEYQVRKMRQFSDKEIHAAQALHVEPAHLVGDSERLHAEKYDWSVSCPRCMRVPEPDGPLVGNTSAFEGAAIVKGRRGELVVNEQIAIRMIREKISGAILRDIREIDEAFEPPEDQHYYEILPLNRLPRLFSPPTQFEITGDVCGTCGHGGLHLHSMLYYDIPVDEVADINVTQELFGDGPGIAPEIVVSPRFHELLREEGAALDIVEPVLFV